MIDLLAEKAQTIEPISRAFAPWAALLLVTFGWIVSHTSANTRERRKEIRAAVDQFRDVISKLKERSVSYHTSDNHSPLLAMEIKSDLMRLSLIGNFQRHLNAGETFDRIIAELHDVITFENFDSASLFEKKEADSTLIQRIDATVEVSYRIVEQKFYERYYGKRIFLRARDRFQPIYSAHIKPALEFSVDKFPLAAILLVLLLAIIAW